MHGCGSVPCSPVTRFLPLLVLLAACSAPPSTPIDAPLPTDLVTLEATEAGQLVLRVVDGRVPAIEGKRLDLPIGPTTFLVHHDGGGTGGEEYEGDVPMAGLWLRGRGGARHLLPSLGSRPLRIDTMEDWSVDLPAGVYELSVTLGAKPPGTISPPAFVVVR